MHKLKYLAISIILVMSLSLAVLSFQASARPLDASAQDLGTAKSFAVLGASAVSNTGASILNGDLGIWPNGASSITGFSSATVNGTQHAADGVAKNAQADVTTAYIALAGEACPPANNLTGQDLGGLNLTPGVYCFSSSAQLTGQLILNALGDPNSVWVFQIGSTLTTAPGSSVVFTNGGSGPGCNLFWQVGSSATVDTTTSLKGNILALASITMNTGANLDGRALARTGAVSLDDNTITPVFCAAAAATATATTTSTANATATMTATPTTTSTATPTTTSTATRTAIPGAATSTPTATATKTATRTATSTATRTAIPGAATSTPTATATKTTTPTATPTTKPTATATHLPAVTGLPGTGGGPIQNEAFPWSLAIVAGIGVIALLLGVRAYRSTYRPK